MIAVGPELEHTKVTIITWLWSHPPNTYTNTLKMSCDTCTMPMVNNYVGRLVFMSCMQGQGPVSVLSMSIWSSSMISMKLNSHAS